MYFFVLVFGYCCGTDRHLWLQGESLNCAQWSMILHFVNEDLALDIMRVTLLCKIASFLFLTKIWILIIKKHIRLTSGERHLSGVNVCLQRNIKQRKWNTDLIWYDLNNVVLKRHWHENWMLIVRWYDVWIFFLHVISIYVTWSWDLPSLSWNLGHPVCAFELWCTPQKFCLWLVWV